MGRLIPYKDNLCSKYATKMLFIKINNVCNRHCEFCVDCGGWQGQFIDVEKIAVDTKDTFKVIYSDAIFTDDWIFESSKLS